MPSVTNNPIPVPLQAHLGVQRDGTRYKAQAFLEAQWVRFYNGYPEKIGGYQMIDTGNGEIVSNMFSVPRSNSYDVYLGRASSLCYFNQTKKGVTSGETARTPTTGFVADPENVWSFALVSVLDSITHRPQSQIVAQVAPNRSDLGGEAEGPIFIGNISDNSPLTLLTDTHGDPVLCSGGILTFNDNKGPIIVAYGNDGQIKWNTPGHLNDFSNSQFVSKTKIVKGIEYFGTLLFWTIGGSLIQCTYNSQENAGGFFSVKVLMPNISILSAGSVVQYNQLVFWIGNGQFYVFNGTVGRVLNYMSSKYFFSKLDEDNESKCFGLVIPEYDEIWFFYPRKSDTNDPQKECNAAVVHTYERRIWHDVRLSRSSAIILNRSNPIMTSSELVTILNQTSTAILEVYPIWKHEVGRDEVDIYGNRTAINAYFEYPIFDLFSAAPSADNNRLVTSVRLEPDFILEGEMNFIIKSRMFAQGPVNVIGPFTFNGNTPYIDIDISNAQGRLLSVEFSTNSEGGYFIAGKILHDIIPGDFNPL